MPDQTWSKHIVGPQYLLCKVRTTELLPPDPLGVGGSRWAASRPLVSGLWSIHSGDSESPSHSTRSSKYNHNTHRKSLPTSLTKVTRSSYGPFPQWSPASVIVGSLFLCCTSRWEVGIRRVSGKDLASHPTIPHWLTVGPWMSDTLHATPKSSPTRRVPSRGTPRVPAPLHLNPFCPPHHDRRVDSPALSGRGPRPSQRTSGWRRSDEEIRG